MEKPKKLSAAGPFIVWSPDGETPPKISHSTHGAAHFAAKQMAKLNPGQVFMVMQKSGRLICHWPDEETPAPPHDQPQVDASSPHQSLSHGDQ